ncbi:MULTISPECIES: class I SAM-dependent methyltransferase [Gordonia]|uniref:Methyltransferase C-terminal domain-containing protein n=1 Tax=Gordonia tangerina TaxID=2911060 RepID=A0ABS9DPL2_9ACTN|nr:methyltransferase domain-containing protein [Gordonia tangerina]MCF3940155.1 methyltransferase C-terminal domain-containing protein [Gordonia tangerina]
MSTCRNCRETALERVLDLGSVPAADHFPPVDQPVGAAEAAHPLAMVLCRVCGLAQLASDDTVADEPRGVEPEVLREQARVAVSDVVAAGLLRGSTVREFGSPHGGSWLPLLDGRGFTEAEVADVVFDSLGIMHEPDQAAAFRRRAAATAPGGILLIHFHSLDTIVRQGQWNALRHGHFAYYSMPALHGLLRSAGMSPVTAREYDLYGGTVLVAAVHGDTVPDDRLSLIEKREEPMTDPAVVGRLQTAVDRHVAGLRAWFVSEAEAGRRVYAYGAASRAVALMYLAGLDRSLVAAVADASPAKLGRRMPGTDIPIISPAEMVRKDPDRILLTVPDLLTEVSRQYPTLTGRWLVDDVELGPHSVPDHVDPHSSKAHADD